MNLYCFGDSNTYGYDPRGFFDGRYDKPWPELVAERTGFEVINAGKNGRMIPTREYEIIQFRDDAERNGADVIIVMLGTTINRFKDFMEDILRFAHNWIVPYTNNTEEYCI